MNFVQAINSDISVLIVCNKTGGTIQGDKKYLALNCNYLLREKMKCYDTRCFGGVRNLFFRLRRKETMLKIF